MTTTAITMMIIAITSLWGGLALAIWNLFHRPDLSAAEESPEA